MQKKHLARFEKGAAIIMVCSLIRKSRKRLVRDVFTTFTSHAGVVNDVSETDRIVRRKGEALIRSAHRLCFCEFQTSIFYQQDDKWSEKLLYMYVKQSLHSGRAPDASSASIPL